MAKNVVLVTGASSGIGRAAALLFALSGFEVAAVGRNEDELALLREGAQTESLVTFTAELTDAEQLETLVAETLDRFKRLDVLINAAGIIKNGTIENTTPDDWDAMLNINLRAVFLLIQKCVPHLQKTRGCIVNVSSVTGLRASPNVLAYCVSKAAVDQLTRCAALELASSGVRVNAVNPGVVETNLHKRGGMSSDDYQRFLSNAANTHPLGRAGTPEEVAELIFYLASDRAGWITGVTYEIDGGRGQTCAR